MRRIMKETVEYLVAALFIMATVVIAHAGDLETLLKDLDEGDETKRAVAAKKIGELGDKSAVEPLMEALEKENEREDESDKVEQYIVKSLGQLKDPGAVDTLIKVLKGEEEEDSGAGEEGEKNYVRIEAANSLSLIGGDKAKAALKDALNDEDASVKRAAEKALKKLE